MRQAQPRPPFGRSPRREIEVRRTLECFAQAISGLKMMDGDQQFNSPPDRAFAFGGVRATFPSLATGAEPGRPKSEFTGRRMDYSFWITTATEFSSLALIESTTSGVGTNPGCARRGRLERRWHDQSRLIPSRLLLDSRLQRQRYFSSKALTRHTRLAECREMFRSSAIGPVLAPARLGYFA